MFCMICGKESEQPMCPVCMSYKIVQGKVSNRKLTVKNNSKFMTLPVRSIDSEITKVSVIEVMRNVLLVYAVLHRQTKNIMKE